MGRKMHPLALAVSPVLLKSLLYDGLYLGKDERGLHHKVMFRNRYIDDKHNIGDIITLPGSKLSPDLWAVDEELKNFTCDTASVRECLRSGRPG